MLGEPNEVKGILGEFEASTAMPSYTGIIPGAMPAWDRHCT